MVHPLLFELGQLYVSAQVFRNFQPEAVAILIAAHGLGDWQELSQGDRMRNERALAHGGRITTRFAADGHDVLIITEADRSATVMLYPEEYRESLV